MRSPTPAKQRHAAVRLGDVVDELHDEDGLADAGAAEEANLAALAVGGEKVDDLDARLEDLDLRRLLDEARRRPVDRHATSCVDRGGPSSTGSPMTFRMRPRHSGPTGIAMGAPVSRTSIPRTRPSVAVHRDGADGVLAEVLRDLEREVVLAGRDARVGQLERVQDLGELPVLELDVHDGPDDLHDLAFAAGVGRGRIRGGHGERGLQGGGNEGGLAKRKKAGRVYHRRGQCFNARCSVPCRARSRGGPPRRVPCACACPCPACDTPAVIVPLLSAIAALVGLVPFGDLAALGAPLAWLAGGWLRIRRGHVEACLGRAGVRDPPGVAAAMYGSLATGVMELLWLVGGDRRDSTNFYTRRSPRRLRRHSSDHR